jgi:cobalt/nickel transport system permease protein
MAVLTPLGLLAPGTAFGEDAPADLDLKKYKLDAVPSGLRRYAGFWHHAIFDGYDFRHDPHPVVGYLVSAAAGILFVGLVICAGFAAVHLARRRSGNAGGSGPRPDPLATP